MTPFKTLRGRRILIEVPVKKETAIKLSEKDNGSLIMFPSTIMHGVNPFYDTNDIRITMSGNVSIAVKGKNE